MRAAALVMTVLALCLLAACNMGTPGTTPAPVALPTPQATPMATAGAAPAATPEAITSATPENADASATGGNTDIGINAAVGLALEQANTSADRVIMVKQGMDTENGKKVYEVEFVLDGRAYDYTFDAANGQLIEDDQELDSDLDASQLSDAGLMSLERAAEIALAKVPGATRDELMIELERKGGQYRYEGEIYYGGQEYEFVLDAKDGTELEWKQPTGQ